MKTMIMPLVRPAQLGDAHELSRLAAATFSLACPPSTSADDIAAYIAAELTPARFAAHLACASTSLLAAVVQDALAGYLMLCREPAPPVVKSAKPLELRRLYVLPHYHGAGVANALMAEALQLASAEAYKTLWLSVSSDNQRGIRFYQKHGFVVAGEQIFPVGSDLHRDYVMIRTMA